ncbi:MAG: hypothetical protein EB127_08690 [Alphaproteobacteria bacterium]|nr:hypothetical protein [Alphaproteobacteria bacterium]
MPDSWKNLGGGGGTSIAGAQKNEQNVKDMSEADKKVEEARKKMELEYAKFKEEAKKAYDDLKKKDQDNFDKIAQLNYGVYYVTQEKKKTDINTTIAHLRSKEIMMRTDKVPEDLKEKIKDEVDEEKKRTVDELYVKYKASIDLAVSQKAALDAAEQLILQKEKEKEALREANKQTIARLEADKKAEFERITKETADKVALAKEAQRQEMLGYIIKALVGVGVLFLILGGLLKSISMGIVSVSAFALAYVAATVPMWVIMSVVGVMVLLVVWTSYAKHVKTAVQSLPKVQSPQ